MKVLITTSGLGNRLGNLTKFTNKCLVRVGKVATLTHIINLYPVDTEFVITTGYYSSIVKQYLELAHSNKNITLVDVDKYEGQGSSLLYSMYCAKKHLQEEFIFHACDSLLTKPIDIKPGNTCLSSTKEDNSQYRTLVLSDNNILNIEEKGSLQYKDIHIGVVRISNFKEFWSEANYLLNSFPTDTSLSDCHVINRLLANGISFSNHPVEGWCDIGNSKSLNDTKELFEKNSEFNILFKEEENIYFFDTFVLKFFSSCDIVKNRVARMDFLRGYGPELLGYTKNFYKYKFVEGELASHNTDVSLYKNLLRNLKENYWERISSSEDFYNKTKDFYYNKTLGRVNLFFKQTGKEYGSLNINGLEVEDVQTLISKIPERLLCTRDKYYFHGDFILDNLLIKDNEFKFLDWRQDFCGEIDGGDMYYDLAKMNHSLHFDHDIISKNNFFFKEAGNIITVDLYCKFSSIQKIKAFNDFLKEYHLDVLKVNILTPIIWLNMSPLHTNPLNKFLFFLGLYKLQQIVNEL